MIIKYQIDIDKDTVIKSLTKITNRVFKVLPIREEGGEWKTTLQNIIIELAGMNSLLIDQVDFFSLLCRMEGMLTLDMEDDFMIFRSNVFECLGMLTKIKECL